MSPKNTAQNQTFFPRGVDFVFAAAETAEFSIMRLLIP